jgi:hypothetical protein
MSSIHDSDSDAMFNKDLRVYSPVPPTDWRALCAELFAIVEAEYSGTSCLAELRIRTATALAQPEPQGPTDEELLELSAHHGVSYTMSSGEVVYPMQHGCDMRDDVLSFARAVLARWGRRAIAAELEAKQ